MSWVEPHQKTIVLTRPRISSREFAQSLLALQPSRTIEIMPLRQVKKISKIRGHDLALCDALVASSPHVVTDGDHFGGKPAYCIGAQTAARLENAGAIVHAVYPDIDQLIRGLATRPAQKLLWLRGEVVTKDLMASLPMHEVIANTIYDVSDIDWQNQQIKTLQSHSAAIFPVFSTQSWPVLQRNLARIGQIECHIVPFSKKISAMISNALNSNPNLFIHLRSSPINSDRDKMITHILTMN